MRGRVGLVQKLLKSQLFDFREGVYWTLRRSSVIHKVDMVVVGASRRKGSTLSSTENAEKVIVVLRGSRPEFCIMGGERVIDEGGIYGGTRLGGFWNQRGAR